MRPLHSHRHDGGEAYLDGTGLERCPHAAGSLKALDWRVGWLERAVRDPLAHDADLDELADEQSFRLEVARRDRRAAYGRIAASLPTAKAAAKAVGIPLSRWPLNCHGIATAIHDGRLLTPLSSDHGLARVAYGVYRGPISEGSPFAERAFAHHGWIEFESGLVVDPTRWVFEGTAPALAAAPIDDYDLAGRHLRQTISPRPLPPFDGAGRTFRWDVNDPETTAAMAALLGTEAGWDRRIGLAQAGWIANLPLETLGEHAGEIYGFLERQGLIALVPIDHRNWVQDGRAAMRP